MASEKTKCWKPLQRAPRVDETSLYSEDEILIFSRLRERYNCSGLTYDQLTGKTDRTTVSRFPVSSVSFSAMDEVYVKRESLTPVSSLGSPRQRAVSITSLKLPCRSLMDTGSCRQGQDLPVRLMETDTENRPVVDHMRDWENENHMFIPQAHQKVSTLKNIGYSVEEYTEKDYETTSAKETDRQPISFPFLHKQKLPLGQSTDLSAAGSGYRGVAVGWDTYSLQDDADIPSYLCPGQKKNNLLEQNEKTDLNIMECSESKIAPYSDGMPRSSGNSLVSETESTSKRMLWWEKSPSKITSTPRWSVSENEQRMSSSVNDDSELFSDPQTEMKYNKTCFADILGHKTSVYRMQQLNMSVSDSIASDFLSTPQALSRGHHSLPSVSHAQELSHQYPSERKRRVNSTDTLDSHKLKSLYPASSCLDSRNAVSACSTPSESRMSAKLKNHAAVDKEARRDRIQKKITDFTVGVKRKKTRTLTETSSHRKEWKEEDDEDPLSALNTHHHRTSDVNNTHNTSSEDEETSMEHSKTLPQYVLDVSALKEEQRQQLSAMLLKDHSSIGCLVLYENGTTNTDSSILKRPKVEGLLLHCKEKSYFLPVPERSDACTLQWSRNVLQGLLIRKDRVKVAINSKQFVIALLHEFSLGHNRGAVAWQFEDPLVAGWLLRPDNPPHTLRAVCKSAHITYNDKGPDSDLRTSIAVMDNLRASLVRENLWLLFIHVEMALTPLLAVMELQAIRVNVHAFLTFSQILKKKMEKLEKKAYELAGHTFCINSTQQLRQLLYEELKLDQQLPGSRKVALTAAAHHKSTSEATLKQLVSFHPLPALILEYRHLCKLKSTYIDGMLEAVEEGALHTHWDQTSAATGRLVSAQPNLQAIPKTPTIITDIQDNFIVGSEKESCEIYTREPFIANEGNVFLAADFQQIELRLLAHLANDPALKEMFLSGDKSADIFIQLTAQWLTKAYKDVTHAEREQTKRVVYSILYGVGKERLAEYLKVTTSRAKDIMDSFLVSFPAIQVFTKKCVDYAQKHGYTETVMGRKRWLDCVHHKAAPVRAQAERQAVNFCVQGSAADLCKRAMVKVEQALHERTHLSSRMLMHIHDELVWELPKDQLPEMCELVKRAMEDDALLCRPLLPGLTVPITVSLSAGTSWAHLLPCH